jgi:SNF2 family DNA or RNA helicase
VPGSAPAAWHLYTIASVLAVHTSWSGKDQTLLVWAEDGDLPAAVTPRRGRPPPAARKPARHPFAASSADVARAIGDLGPFAGVSAETSGVHGTCTLWLPGTPDSPEASPQLVRAEPDTPPGVRTAREGDGRGTSPTLALHPFVVPVLRVPPGPALDFLVTAGSPGADRPGLHMGASVRALGAVAELALEIAAGGRVLPDLVADGGRHVARWAALGGGADAERAGQLAASLPPVCRALSAEGEDPVSLVGAALGAFVDAACRDALRAPLLRAPRAPSSPPRAVESWLAALSTPRGVVEADAGELAKLERLVAEWRAGAAGRGGPWRLCFRLREPDDGDAGLSQETGSARAPGPDGPWRLELLLQATDDLSLVVDAAEVWRSAEVLRSATRTLDDPHEVLLAELGRAVRAYPELAAVLREPAPVALDTDLEGAHRFLAEVAPALELTGFGVLLPSWWRNPSTRLGLKLRSSSKGSRSSSGLLTGKSLAAFDWRAALGDQEIGIRELRRLAELKQPLVRVRGQWTELRPDELAKLADFLSERRASAQQLTVADVLRIAAGVPGSAPVTGVPVVGVEADGVLGAMLRGELDAELEVRGTPPGFQGELRPYQARGVAWIELLERLGLGGCLADDMGLGKTATVLAVVQAERGGARRSQPASGRTRDTSRAARSRATRVVRAADPAGTARSAGTVGPAGPTLVVCPTSVVGNWQREAERFAPELSVVVHHGTGRARGDDLRRQIEGADLVVTSYPLVERDRAALSSVAWGRVVLDEAQHVKNPAAKQTRAVRALPAPKRLALTGTPVENHLGDLWSIMEILNPGLLGSERAFRERFAVPIERYHEEDAAERLKTLTRPFVLRRLKTDRTIITDLPEKLEMKVVCTLTKEQATLYQAVVDEMLQRIEESEGIERKGLVLAAMLRLKQVCNHPAQYLGDGSRLERRSGKLERTVELLEQVLESGEKALVFTQFAEMGHMLQSHLGARLGCRVSFLHGGVPRRRRDEMVAELQAEGGAVPIMVLSVKAGGTGLNLTAANHVVHFDRWWNPAVENQATDRAFRIGQRRDVQVRKLVCAGTVEDRIDQLIESKRDLAERIVGTGEGWLTELSTDELADVFRLSAETVGDW